MYIYNLRLRRVLSCLSAIIMAAYTFQPSFAFKLSFKTGECDKVQCRVFDIKDNMFAYSGYYRDTESGMYYLNARYYSSELMRFINRDTYDLSNRYAYCNGNPISNTDPKGHISNKILFSFIGGIIFDIATLGFGTAGLFMTGGALSTALIPSVSGLVAGGTGITSDITLLAGHTTTAVVFRIISIATATFALFSKAYLCNNIRTLGNAGTTRQGTEIELALRQRPTPEPIISNMEQTASVEEDSNMNSSQAVVADENETKESEEECKIPEEKVKTPEEERVCPICFEPINDEKPLFQSEHICNIKNPFHKDCLRPWFNAGNKTCPNCRAILNDTDIAGITGITGVDDLSDSGDELSSINSEDAVVWV